MLTPIHIVCDGYSEIFWQAELVLFFADVMSCQIVYACQGGARSPHRMTFGSIKFHLPIGLPLGKAVQVILQNLVIHGGFYILFTRSS